MSSNRSTYDLDQHSPNSSNMAQQDMESDSEATITVQGPPQETPEKQEKVNMNPWHPDQYPDGGFKAWLVTAGAFFCVFCSFGWINCEHTLEEKHDVKSVNKGSGIGIFQDYYQLHQLRSYSSSTISWIASLQLFIMFAGVRYHSVSSSRIGPTTQHADHARRVPSSAASTITTDPVTSS